MGRRCLDDLWFLSSNVCRLSIPQRSQGHSISGGKSDKFDNVDVVLVAQISVSGGDSRVGVYLVWGDKNYNDWVNRYADIPEPKQTVHVLSQLQYSQEIVAAGEVRANVNPNLPEPEDRDWWMIIDNRFSSAPSDKVVRVSVDVTYNPRPEYWPVVLFFLVLALAMCAVYSIRSRKRHERATGPPASFGAPAPAPQICQSCGFVVVVVRHDPQLARAKFSTTHTTP